MTEININVFLKNPNFLDNPIFRPICIHFSEKPSAPSIFILDLRPSFIKQNPKNRLFLHHPPPLFPISLLLFHFFFQLLPFSSSSLFPLLAACSPFWLFPPFYSSSPFLLFSFLSFPLSLSSYPSLPWPAATSPSAATQAWLPMPDQQCPIPTISLSLIKK